MGGFESNKARLEALNRLGKDLARRARRRCELCESSEGKLRPWEIPPAPEDPDLERTLLLCQRCHDGAGGGRTNPNEWRFLEPVVWSELPAVQVTAVRLLRRFAEEGAAWADAVLDGVYLSPEVEAWVEGTPPEPAA